jgi:hypothetical protein
VRKLVARAVLAVTAAPELLVIWEVLATRVVRVVRVVFVP